MSQNNLLELRIAQVQSPLKCRQRRFDVGIVAVAKHRRESQDNLLELRFVQARSPQQRRASDGAMFASWLHPSTAVDTSSIFLSTAALRSSGRWETPESGAIEKEKE